MLFKLKHTLNEIDMGFGYTYMAKEKCVSETLKSIQFEKEKKEEEKKELFRVRTQEARFKLKEDYIYSQKVKHSAESVKYIDNLSECGLKVIKKLNKETRIKNDFLTAFCMLCKNYFINLSIKNQSSISDLALIDFEYHPEKLISYIENKQTLSMKLKYHHLRNNELTPKERIMYSDLIKLIDFTNNHLTDITDTLRKVINDTLFDELHKKIDSLSLEECIKFREKNAL